MTPRRLRAITATLLCAGLLASATLVSGSSAPPHPAAPAAEHAQQR
jgi:hypothetical protein